MTASRRAWEGVGLIVRAAAVERAVAAVWRTERRDEASMLSDVCVLLAVVVTVNAVDALHSDRRVMNDDNFIVGLDTGLKLCKNMGRIITVVSMNV